MTAPAAKTWFGQPPGLTILFLTNMWEQFSYYGMRALLVFYMTRQLGMSQGQSSLTYGVYTASVYFTPIIGGIVADRFLGKRRAVTIGAAIMAIGHFLMAFPQLFYVALATIALGNGLFLPSLPSQINDLYQADDPRRGWAYNVYYVGINIGGFLAPLVCGTLAAFYGWHYGFGAAGLGMLVGLIIYLAGQKHLPTTAPARREPASQIDWRRYRQAFALLAAVGFIVTIFRGGYEQVGNTVALWSETDVDRQVGAFAIPPAWFQSLNPLLVFLFTPLLLAFWRRRAEQGRDPSPLRRMATGALIVALSYLLLALIAGWAAPGQAHWPWLLLFFMVFTLGELYILPAGLSLFARAAPERLAATTIAAWYLAIFTGSIFAGVVGTLWEDLPHEWFFVVLFLLCATASALLLSLSILARRTGMSDTPDQQIVSNINISSRTGLTSS